jgi:glyceraldehyde 3-phosphate dehydrogenase
VVKVIHESLGIRHGQITTIHDPTNTNVGSMRRTRICVAPLGHDVAGADHDRQRHRDRADLSELKGKLDGHAVRAPVLNASLTDCVFELKRPTSADEVNELFATAARGRLAGILGS